MAKRNGGLRLQSGGGERRSAAALPVGKKQRLQVERLAHDGRGIAFVEGRSWFVSGALPGETVEARVLAARSQVVDARVERVLEASPERRTPPCEYYGRCGGCSLQHLPHAEQLALKQRNLADQLERGARLHVRHWAAPLSGDELAYRRRARVAVRWDAKRQALEVGFRAAASQAIVEVSHCPVLVQPLQPLLEALPGMLRELDAPRAIGHVELFQGVQAALLVRHTAALGDADLQRLRAFAQAHAAQLWLQGAGEPQSDSPQAGYQLEGMTLGYRPGDFVQVNGALNQAMVAQALEWLAPRADERVLDLFCGLGNFALPLARRAQTVVGVEGVAGMVERARANAQANELGNAHFFQADLSKPLASTGWAEGGFSAVLLDPPRDGALEVVRQLDGLGAQRVLYVSCNPATLARDAAQLVAQGFSLVRAGLIDMFPQTAHVEAMALFER